MRKLLNKGNKVESFEHYLNAHKNNIQILCSSYDAQSSALIEYDDLYQESAVKLLQLYYGGKPLDINHTTEAIKNHIVSYIRKNTKGNMVDFNIDNLLYSCNEREYEQ